MARRHGGGDAVGEDKRRMKWKEPDTSETESETSTEVSETTLDETQQKVATALLMEQKKKYDEYMTGNRPWEIALTAWHYIVTTISTAMFMVGLYFRFSSLWFIRSRLAELQGFENYTKVMDVYSRDDFYFDGSFNVLMNLIMVINALYVLCTVIYMAFRGYKNASLLPIACFITCVLTLTEITVLETHFNLHMFTKENKPGELIAQMNKDYTIRGSNDITLSHDHFAAWLGCCYMVSSVDYRGINLEFDGHKLQVPPVCCKRSVFVAGLDKVLECASNRNGDIHEKFCFTAYMEWLHGLVNVYSIYTWLHVIDCAIHALIYKRRVVKLDRLS